MEQYYSQFGEDKLLNESGILPEMGVFMDVGAGDPERLSNTFFFEKRGWDGVCIDPDPRQYANLVQKRKKAIQGAVGAADGFVAMNFWSHPDLSRVEADGKEKVPCYRLETILKDSGFEKVDLVSIDVEGQELEVMKGFDPVKYGVKVIIIEFLTTGIPSRKDEIMVHFKDLPYTLFAETTANLIFKAI